jgi:hypothetical protein
LTKKNIIVTMSNINQERRKDMGKIVTIDRLGSGWDIQQKAMH